MFHALDELRYLKGVGPRRAEALAAQGVRTLEDLLYHLPFRYEDRRAFAHVGELLPGGPEQSLSVHVDSSRLIRTRRRGFTIFQAVVSDPSGHIKAIWYNQPYLARLLVAGARVVLFGRASLDRYRHVVLENPEFEFLDDDDAEGIHTGRVVPVYRKLGDCNSRVLRGLMFRALSEMGAESFRETIPAATLARHDLPDRFDALRRCHFPNPEVRLGELVRLETPGQRYLAFEEIFLLQLALALRRRGLREEARGITYEIPEDFRTRMARLLPFKLTRAQKRVLREIATDLKSDHPMHRLLQGDVGSGKTIVALLTLLVAVENGYQAALMAPTEILAEQHRRNIDRLLEGADLECRTCLLSGSLRAAERRAVLEQVRSGAAQLVIGTHALFEKAVEYSRLGMIVVDEQHRFGVLQRAALAEKGLTPDVLVMTATPIPRSLALTLYGDLDLSVIDELPPGRTPIKTVVRGDEERSRMYEWIRGEIGKGRQVYFVVPLVEETSKSDLKDATRFAEQLRRDIFPRVEVGMIHGKMKSGEKDRVMQRFTDGEIPVLVATTVIEVGVDVANASVMVIEHAERFGLSQLHQLRGRVGRGAERSFCVLMIGDAEHGREARERLKIMKETTDGFRIAQRDLELRGPGAVFGTQQHGLTDLQFLAEVLRAPDLVEGARSEAQAIVEARGASGIRAEDVLDALGGRWQRRLDLGRVG